MKPRPLVLSLAVVLLLLSGCDKRHALVPTQPSLTDPGLAERQAEPDRHRHRGAREIRGRIGRSFYALYRPAQWNGDLVLYAHGFTAPTAPVALPTGEFADQARDLLLSRGFAVAFSSFSENGYAVKDGAQRTEELTALFRARLGRPKRVFLVGLSLGGQIVQMLAEQYPRRYAGAVTFSGVLGGTRRELDYVATVRVLFDYFYPGVLPGDLLHLPKGLDLDRDVIGPAVAAMAAHPERAFALSQIAQAPVPFADGNELVGSIVQALVLQAIELEDLLRRTRGQSFFDNQKTVYAGPLPPELLADLNARVARHRSGPEAERFMERYYEPTGRLRIPLLALHATRDPVVPYFHEEVYRDRVAAAGRAGMLEQRVQDRYGHSGFGAEEIVAAFEGLVEWVDGARKPDRPKHPLVARAEGRPRIEAGIAAARVGGIPAPSLR
jgi:pimeloyl-ACP methyl ester carboxylesterase